MADVESSFAFSDGVESDFEDDDVFNMSYDEENVAPPTKGSKPASKKSGGSGKGVLASNGSTKVAAKAGGKKTVEQMYQKKTQLEHILLRPDTYIGSVEPLKTNMFVFDDATKRMVGREITYTPGLYKIFDESKW